MKTGWKEVCEFAKVHKYQVHLTDSERILGPLGIGRDPPPPCWTEIKIKNVPRHFNEVHVYNYFSEFGEIYRIRMVLSANKLTHNGVAYVNFHSSIAVRRAIASKQNSQMAPGYSINLSKYDNNRRLFLGGVPDHWRKLMIIKELYKIALTSFINVMVFRSTIDINRNTGYCFIEFATHREAELALYSCQGKVVFGNPIYIDFTVPVSAEGDMDLQQAHQIFLRNLRLQDRTTLLRTLQEALGNKFQVDQDQVYHYKDYAFIHFKKAKHAKKAFPELHDYYNRRGGVEEVLWAIPEQIEYIGLEELY